MSELEKAKQIAAEAFNFKSKAYTTIEQQNEIIKVNRKAFMQILSLSSLTIPKSIADELDDIFNGFVKEQESCDIRTLLYRAEEQDFEIGVRLDKLLPEENQINIAVAYLAGKGLGVDLVKVVEG